MHTTATDGRELARGDGRRAAHRLGYQYIAITDHCKSLAMANGLDERRALEHAARVRALNGRFEGLTLLAGIECDILADGSLDLADDCLAQLDIVVASIHSHFSQEQAQMTDRVLRALDCRWVDVLGHPTGRRLLQRQALRAWTCRDRRGGGGARRGAGDQQPGRSAGSERRPRPAGARHGATFVISSDAHSTGALANVRWGVQVARRGWLTAEHMLNTYPLERLRPALPAREGRLT